MQLNKPKNPANIIQYFKVMVFLLGFIMPWSFAVNVPISLFPIEHYSQDIDQWLDPSELDYNTPLLSRGDQIRRLRHFYQHVYATSGPVSEAHSPWNGTYVNQLFTQKPNLKMLEQKMLAQFGHPSRSSKHMGYGENFRPHPLTWIKQIERNIPLDQLEHLSYQQAQRGIALKNLNSRLLPTDDPHFYHFTQPGQGYPFDNLQNSSLWAGTPVYIIAHTDDKAWDLVITPDFIAWVHSDGVARVSQYFVERWSKQAKHHMVAIIQTKTPIIDTQGQFQFYAYVGSVFPLMMQFQGKFTVWIPKQGCDGLAHIRKARLSNQQAVVMPFLATRHHFARMIHTLVNRPYGWGGLYFYNDCSQELKSLFTPFGIWLPRHSSAQVGVGKVVDMTAADLDQRLHYLLRNGRPLMTLIDIGGHIMLYLGARQIPNHGLTAMTYQNLWGLAPYDKKRRSVIGESVFLPLLRQYPEDKTLASLANHRYFKLGYLDQWPTYPLALPVTLKSLVSPG